MAEEWAATANAAAAAPLLPTGCKRTATRTCKTYITHLQESFGLKRAVKPTLYIALW